MGSLGIYFMSLFKCPETVTKKLEAIRARFFWGASYEKGGLNVGSLQAFNIALLQKWRWRYLVHPGDLWVSVIQAIHGNRFDKVNVSSHSTWSTLVTTCNDSVSNGFLPNDAFFTKVGNGSSVRFWFDTWCGNSSLFTRFNRLFHLDLNQQDTIANKWCNGEWVWTWSRSNLGGRNSVLFEELKSLVSQFHAVDRDDYWTFSISSDGLFSVKVARDYIDHIMLPSSSVATIWFKFIPRKVNIFLWRLSRDALPLHWNLSAKGIDISSIVCPVCNNGIENVDHLFFSCSVAKEIWIKIRVWLNCNMPSFGSWESFLSWIEGSFSNNVVLFAVKKKMNNTTSKDTRAVYKSDV
ncbi:uncharacterized protein [Rutidosis leptorrhynchoides]|uniref:uncharacterized protein n=1 Tax=Rutidosis leptorrhynchoides TaxID=125765 RepID=UPI003A9A27C7